MNGHASSFPMLAAVGAQTLPIPPGAQDWLTILLLLLNAFLQYQARKSAQG
jgi:hypothetical protein